jgi:hypothetical protein
MRRRLHIQSRILLPRFPSQDRSPEKRKLNYLPFRNGVPRWKENYLRVTHPSAALLMAEATFSLDLHVLGPPLTFALSQDQTLHRKFEPALRRWIAAPPGGGRHPTWNGFLLTETHLYRMTCYPVFRDRCPVPFGAVPVAFRRRGCCLYAAAPLSSTPIRKKSSNLRLSS